MDLGDVVRVAVRVGSTLGQHAGHDDLVRVLRAATGADAVLLCAGRGDAEHRELASVGYPSEVAWHAVHTFPRTHWWRTVVGAPLPPGISATPEAAFTDGDYYRRHVAPAGFRDGLSVPLRAAGAYAGMLHLSTRREGMLTVTHQGVLAALAADIGTAVVADAVAGSRRLRVRDGRVTGAADEPALHDDELVAVLRQVAARATTPVRLTWPARPRWWRVVVEPTAGGAVVDVEPVDRPGGITARELGVLTALSTGASNAAIAADLVVSPRTVHTHVEHLLAKLAVPNRTMAAVRAVREGLLRPEPDPARLAGVPALLGRRPA